MGGPGERLTDFESVRPKHIVLVVHGFYPDHFYGTEGYTRALARQFMARGHRVTVLTARYPGETRQETLVEEYTIHGISVVRIDRNQNPPVGHRDSYAQPSLEPLFTDILRRLAPDIVHVCHLENHTTALLTAAEALGIPIFATLTDFFNLCLTGSLETTDGVLCKGPNWLRTNCMACGLAMRAREAPSPFWNFVTHPRMRPGAARTAALTPFFLPASLSGDARGVTERPAVLRHAMEKYRAAIAPTSFLRRAFENNGCPCPIELSFFGIDLDRSPKAQRPEGPLRLGFIGQLAYQKGAHILLQALLSLPSERYTLEIWGSEAPQSFDYARDLRDVGSRMPVTFKGTFAEDQAAAVLANIDFLIMPSTWYENSPLTLLKALATHTPVVVSDVEGMTEYIDEGINGFAFPRGDVEALAAILDRLTKQRDLATTMSQTTSYDRTEGEMAQDVLRMYRRYGLE